MICYYPFQGSACILSCNNVFVIVHNDRKHLSEDFIHCNVPKRKDLCTLTCFNSRQKRTKIQLFYLRNYLDLFQDKCIGVQACMPRAFSFFPGGRNKSVLPVYQRGSIMCSCSVILMDCFKGMCVLQQWEVAVVSRLDWCLASVVPSDFLEPILHALPFVWAPHLQNIRRHVNAYVALAATGKLHNCVTYTWSGFLKQEATKVLIDFCLVRLETNWLRNKISFFILCNWIINCMFFLFFFVNGHWMIFQAVNKWCTQRP